MEDRVVVGERVEAGVIAEGAFVAQFAGFDVAFEDEFGVGRDFDIDGLALHHLDRALAEEAGDHHLVEVGRQGQDGGVHGRRVGADGDRHFHAGASLASAAAVVFRALFVGLPVHAAGAFVEDLHTVHAAVALAGVGVFGEDHGERDEAPAIVRPALQDGEIEEREAVLADDLLARPFGDDPGKESAHLGEFGQHLELADDAFGHAHFEEFGDAGGDLIDGRDFERDLHLAHRREPVDQHGKGGAFGPFEEQRGAALFDGAVGELGDFEPGVDFDGHPLQFAVLFEGADELSQILVSHGLRAMVTRRGFWLVKVIRDAIGYDEFHTALS